MTNSTWDIYDQEQIKMGLPCLSLRLDVVAHILCSSIFIYQTSILC